MTQKGVEEELKRLLVEKEKEIADYQDHLECLQWAPGYPTSTAHIPNPLQKTMDGLQKELNQDSSSSDNVVKLVPKKKMSKNVNYSPTKVKARNFLTNVSYNRIKNSDFENRSFIIDCYSFILLYLNPFYLKRKFENILDREFVKVIWCLLMLNNFYNFISQSENFKVLNKLKLKYQEANEILKSFTDDKTQFQMLKDFLIRNLTHYQFVFGNLFPKCFARIDEYGVKNKTSFDNQYKTYLSQKNVYEWQQNAFLPQLKDENNETPLNLSEVNDADFFDELKKETVAVKITEVDGTSSEKMKNKKRKRVLTDEKTKKRNEKKKKLEKKFEENEKKKWK